MKITFQFLAMATWNSLIMTNKDKIKEELQNDVKEELQVTIDCLNIDVHEGIGYVDHIKQELVQNKLSWNTNTNLCGKFESDCGKGFTGVFVCTICCLIFITEIDLTEHQSNCLREAVEINHQEKGLVQCQVCKVHWSGKQYLEEHLALCEERQNRNFERPNKNNESSIPTGLHKKNRRVKKLKVSECNVFENSFDDLHNDIDFSDGDNNSEESDNEKYSSFKLGKQKEFKCKKCDEKFTSKRELSDHKAIHKNEELFPCNSCDYVSKKKATLKLHIKEKHFTGHDKEFQCAKCVYQTNNPSTFKRHVGLHDGLRQFKCDVCNKYFTQKYILKTHKLIHSGEKRFQCSHCGKQFTQKATLEKHNLTHTGQKYLKCPICNKRFTQKFYLNGHIRGHTEEKQYQCGQCEKRFTEEYSLKKHRRIHNVEKKFKCSMCDKRFLQESSLKLHFLIHTGERPYECDICGYSFNRKHHLERHVNKKHK